MNGAGSPNKQDNYGLQSSCHSPGTAERKEARYYHPQFLPGELGRPNCLMQARDVAMDTPNEPARWN